MKSDVEIWKADLRQKMSAQRDALHAASKLSYDRRICDLLEDITDQAAFRTVHCYLPIRSEIDIIPFIHRLLESGITVVTSKVAEHGILEHVVVNSLADLVKGRFGTHHPRNAPEYHGAIDAVIVPGLAFDKHRYRLGYGGGYYDRFLSGYPDAVKIGVFYPFQEVRALPVEPHDIKLNEIVTATWEEEERETLKSETNE